MVYNLKQIKTDYLIFDLKKKNAEKYTPAVLSAKVNMLLWSHYPHSE